MSVTVTGDKSVIASFMKAAAIGANVRKAVQVTARNVKDDAKQIIGTTERIPHYASGIQYIMQSGTAAAGIYEAHVVVMGRQQARLAGVLENGTGRNAAWPHFAPAANKNEPDLLHGVNLAITAALA